MNSDFLLELLSEEIPARMQAKARNDLARIFSEMLLDVGLSHDGITTYSTPRRLALIARKVPLIADSVTEEIKGPRTSAPPAALEGFLRKTGLTQSQLEDRDGVWFSTVEKAGKPTSEIFAARIPLLIWRFPWPKSMRWGEESKSTESLRWVRPLQGIVAIHGQNIVPFSLDMGLYFEGPSGTAVTYESTGLNSGASTLGHRFHHPGPITIGGAHDYVEKLRACHVLVDQEEREAIVRKGAVAAAEKAGLQLVEDEGLVVENAGLTEWPVPLLGGFDPDYLDVPEEVIVLTARTNQKYFAMRDGAGELAPNFVCVANIDANDGGTAIVAGNERVLAARLADARFFWQQDLKIPLEEQARKLEQIVFHEKLGTVADKVERVAKLARWLVEEGIVKPSPLVGEEGRGRAASAAQKNLSAADAAGPPPVSSPTRGEEVSELAALAERAARLAKADLVTGMVGEFPELQGVIGGHLARAQGEPDAIADAIRDHYKPVGQGDDVPTAPVTVAVSLAEKLDEIIAFNLVKEFATGSKDPLGLRRSALSLLRIILENDLRLNLRPLMMRAWQEAVITWNKGIKDPTRGAAIAEFTRTISTHSPEAIFGEHEEFARFMASTRDGFLDDVEPNSFMRTQAFVLERLKAQQREAGVRHDLIDAVFALGGEDDLVRLLARVKALQSFVETGEGANLLAGYKRAANILKKETWDVASASDADVLPDEDALVSALDAAGPTATAAVEAEDFTAAMSALASLRAPIDAFFGTVIVNDPDLGVRARRLNLLARFRDAVHAVADFSKIEG